MGWEDGIGWVEAFFGVMLSFFFFLLWDGMGWDGTGWDGMVNQAK